MKTATRFRTRDAVVATALAFFVWTMARGLAVPVLTYVDQGMHEVGHAMAFFVSDVGRALAGPFAQVTVPAILALFFMHGYRDRHAAALCWGWTATSVADVSRFMADAPYTELEPLLGEHDWSFIFGHLGVIGQAGPIAAGVSFTSWVILIWSAVYWGWVIVEEWL